MRKARPFAPLSRNQRRQYHPHRARRKGRHLPGADAKKFSPKKLDCTSYLCAAEQRRSWRRVHSTQPSARGARAPRGTSTSPGSLSLRRPAEGRLQRGRDATNKLEKWNPKLVPAFRGLIAVVLSLKIKLVEAQRSTDPHHTRELRFTPKKSKDQKPISRI